MDDWTDAFKEHKDFTTSTFNMCENLSASSLIQKAIADAEVIIIHPSMNGDTLKYLSPLVPMLLHRKGKLVAFVGNEVNLPTIGMAPKIDIFKRLQTDIIATQLLQETGEWLYADCNAKIISLPHALNPQHFYPRNSLGNRKIDIGTRSARYGVFIGDNQRNSIIEYFNKIAPVYDLNVDLGCDPKTRRFNREQWSNFLNSCKATVATEAGSYYLQRDDAIINQMLDHVRQKQHRYVLPNEGPIIDMFKKFLNPELKAFVRKMIKPFAITPDKVGNDFNFSQIQDQFFNAARKCPVYSKAISSRHFDAVGTKTLQILYPGRYNDILKAGEHYIELASDHSNIDQIIDLLRDNKRTATITDNAYEHVISKHTHEKRLDLLAQILS